MDGVELGFKTEWESGIVEDIKKIFTHKTVVNVMAAIQADMKQALSDSIERNVYSEKHNVYPRRSENPGYGPALNDMEANVTDLGGMNMDGTKYYVGIRYQPSGEHKGKFGEFFTEEELEELKKKKEDPIKPNPVHGDELIRRIETGKGYDWDYDKARPFWTPFVEEQLSGKLLDSFERAMAMEGLVVTDDGGGVVSETGDGAY